MKSQIGRSGWPPSHGSSDLRFHDLGFWHFPFSDFKILLLLTLFLFLLCSPTSHAAQDVPIPPAPTQWVTDTTGFISPADVERLNARLREYEGQTQRQLIVWIGPTTGQVPIEEWANRAFEQWRVGRRGIDDGLALFIMARDRRLRIEVGYGLESQVPDLLAKRIIDNTIVPRIRAGDNVGAIEAGLDALTQAIGQPLPGQGAAAPAEQRARPITLGRLIFFGVIGLIVLIVFASSPGFALWLLVSLLSGGNRRGRRGGGWGGGFGGGAGVAAEAAGAAEAAEDLAVAEDCRAVEAPAVHGNDSQTTAEIH
jgi:uncharacterized protein